MEVEIVSKKYVKPSTPTPTSLRNFKISFTDELSPTLYVPLILYYPAVRLEPTIAQNGTTNYIYNPTNNILHRMEKSLQLTLTRFYLLAGRYVKPMRLIDCHDQGVEYVQARANVPLIEILGHGAKPAEVLNNFIPREIGESDEIDDPLLAIQVTVFECGGLAIGMCFSHRISDMTTMTTFINNWAISTKDGSNEVAVAPIFNSAYFFPHRGLPELDLRVPRSRIGVQNAARRFLLSRKAISALRSKAGGKGTKPSKVQLVVALLYKAFIRIDQAKNGHSKASFLIQPVNLRDKLVPPLQENSCGNLWGLATTQLKAKEGDNMDFQGFLEILRHSIRKIAKDCAKILSHGEEGYGVVINPFLESNRNIADSEVNFILVTCWCKFSFYEADFGWEKPVWASTVNLPVKNLVILMDDQEGEGVEAWVHLDDKDMHHFEQDPDITTFTT